MLLVCSFVRVHVCARVLVCVVLSLLACLLDLSACVLIVLFQSLCPFALFVCVCDVFVCLLVGLCVCWFVCVCFCVSVGLCVCLFACLFVCFFACLPFLCLLRRFYAVLFGWRAALRVPPAETRLTVYRRLYIWLVVLYVLKSISYVDLDTCCD